MIDAERQALKETLSTEGIVLIRGFDLHSVTEFEKAVKRFSQSELFDYSGGVSPRAAISGRVYNSTEYPPSLTLNLHNELSYSTIFPRYVYFLCIVPPEHRGETTYGDSRRILGRLPVKIVEEFRRRGVCYERNLQPDPASPYSWQAAFETDDKASVEAICQRLEIDLEWRSNGVARLIQKGPATIVHPETREEVWFNQAEGFHTSSLDAESHQFFLDNDLDFRLKSRFADGGDIPEAYLEQIRNAVNAETKAHRWEAGDILILDNILTAHGRRPFSGRRQIAVAMT